MAEILNSAAIELAERGFIPDSLLNFGIERACGQRLRNIREQYSERPHDVLQNFISKLNDFSIAESTGEANEQHYELPAEFFELVLGPRRKYSACEWPKGTETLALAEVVSLQTIVSRADIQQGQRILELGCGWGSLSLFLAEKYPDCEITAVSNSSSQRCFIESKCAQKGYRNLQVVTADINEFEPDGQFDRIVTIEMLEHVRNYGSLFGRMRRWLNDSGCLFVHIFRHKEFAYLFETEGSQNWMGRHFFTGGIMPSHDLLVKAQDSLELVEDWQMNGTDYALTADAWLSNMEKNREAILVVLRAHYGTGMEKVWFNRWKMFFIACRELFGFDNGSEWGVSHYLFK